MRRKAALGDPWSTSASTTAPNVLCCTMLTSVEPLPLRSMAASCRLLTGRAAWLRELLRPNLDRSLPSAIASHRSRRCPKGPRPRGRAGLPA